MTMVIATTAPPEMENAESPVMVLPVTPPPPPSVSKLPPEKIPELKTVTEAVMSIGRKTCRWPYGEPYQNKLAFCGEPTFESYPYCLRHCYHSYANFEEIQAKRTKEDEYRR